MDIKAFNAFGLPQANVQQKTSPVQNNNQTAEIKKEEPKKQKHSNKRPYLIAGGAVVLAGIGAYVFKGKLSKLFNKTNIDKKDLEKTEDFFEKEIPVVKKEVKEVVSQVKENKKIILPTMDDLLKRMFPKPLIKLPANVNIAESSQKLATTEKAALGQLIKIEPNPQKLLPYYEDAATLKIVQDAEVSANTEKVAVKIQEAVQETVKKTKQQICIGFEDGKPIYDDIEKYVFDNLPPMESAFNRAKKDINLGSKEIVARINKNKKALKSDVSRIIEENKMEDGHINLTKMRKVANDFAMDAKNRGEDRFHQAAEMLEQTYIREFIKKDGEKMTGLQNFADTARTDSTLFQIYTQMPMEEAANRLHNLKEKDFKALEYSGMNAEQFFEQCFGRLVEKFQFKKYNEVHGIK